MLTDENPELAELRAIAEKATHGPWRQDSDGDGVVYCDEDECFAVGYGMEPKNAAFIGAANPTTVIALLDGIRDLQKRLYDALINAPMPVLKLDDEQVRLFEANRELATLRARNAQLEANLLDYWAAHGAVRHIEEPRVVRELKAQHREAARQLEAERDGMAKALELARARVAELEAEHEHCSTRISYAEAYAGEVREEMRAVTSERDAALKRVALYTSWHHEVLPALDGARASLAAERDQLATKLAAIEHEDGPPEGTRSFERLAQVTHDWDRAQARVRELEAERLFIIRAHAIEGDHCEDDVVRAIVERLQSSVVGVVWQRDAARATVERVREVATKHRGIVEGAKRSAISSAWRPLDCAVSDIEAALTPPGDGGSR